MYQSIKKRVRSLAVGGAFLLLRSKLLTHFVPFKQPPILILSYPRSGSSWVGKVLSTSQDVAYLREPITQQYIFAHGGRLALVDIQKDPNAFSIYQQLGDDSFKGLPTRHLNVVNNLRDFTYAQRKEKRIMIKEVNPKALGFYLERYSPQVILLIRHPAAVALSFHQLGWLTSPDTQMETDNCNASPWEKFGYAYGTILQNAIDCLNSNGNHHIVVYRHLAEDPYNEFMKLFGALGIRLPENYDAIINQYCYSSKQETSKAEIERTSRNMVFKWKNELTDQQVGDLRTGYFKSNLDYFRDPGDWPPADDGGNS